MASAAQNVMLAQKYVEDKIDPTVGFIAERTIGDEVAQGDLLGTVYAKDGSKAQETAARIQAAYRVSEASHSQRPSLIKEVINE